MYIRKDDLIKRLVKITGKERSEFEEETVEVLSELYESYVAEGERKYLEVPYKQKEIAKFFGARYDADLKKWYIPLGVDESFFDRWKRYEGPTQQQKESN